MAIVGKMILAPVLVLGLGLGLASGAHAASCDKPGFIFAVDTVDDGPPSEPAPQRFDAIAKMGTTVAEGLPEWTYEKSTSWRDVTIVRVDCLDDVTAPVSVDPRNTGDFFSIGLFPASPSPEGDVAPDLKLANCATPVYLLGLNTVTDEATYAVYAKALADSNLPRRYGFRRIFTGVPLKQFAGRWPPNTTATLSEWPCIEAFNTFYNSDVYKKEIFPLRAGSARYRLVAFKPKDKP